MTPTRTAHSASIALLALLIAGALAILLPAPAPAHVSEEEATSAAAAGAQWFADEQAETGALSGDWGMTAFAAAEVHAADVRTGLALPSAQDFYADQWIATGPGGATTDAERAILAGHAGGIQTSRLSSQQNMVSTIAAAWDGTQLGSTGLLNDDIFGVLALAQVDAPAPIVERIADHVRTKQLPDGGWSWSNSPSATADTDMTGSVVAALCAAGADPETDPAIQSAFAYLQSIQDDASGGFPAPPWTPVNTNSTGWVTSGLIQCGIDPQGSDWTTESDKTPLDYLVSMQKEDGRFCWDNVETCVGSAAYATWDAVRPLGGEAFSADPPERENPADPVLRSAPEIAAGTPVPVALVIDHGVAGDVRMCEVEIPSETTIDGVLAAAEGDSTPGDCVTGSATVEGDEGAVEVTELNGIVADEDSAWSVSIDGAAAEVRSSEPVAFGDLVFVELTGRPANPKPNPDPDPDPEPKPKPVDPKPQPKPDPVAALLRSPDRSKAKRKRAFVKVVCPAGSGVEGCSGTTTLSWWNPRAKSRKRGGQSTFSVQSGEAKRIGIKLNRGLNRRLKRRGSAKVRVISAVRNPDGSLGLDRTRFTLQRAAKRAG